MSGFGSGICACCGRRCRWDDDVCSPACDREMERRGDEDAWLLELPEAHEEWQVEPAFCALVEAEFGAWRDAGLDREAA